MSWNSFGKNVKLKTGKRAPTLSAKEIASDLDVNPSALGLLMRTYGQLTPSIVIPKGSTHETYYPRSEALAWVKRIKEARAAKEPT